MWPGDLARVRSSVADRSPIRFAVGRASGGPMSPPCQHFTRPHPLPFRRVSPTGARAPSGG
eukprot:889612-Pyramimonas_sp.AAC.1